MTDTSIDAIKAKIMKKATLLKWGIGLGAALILAPVIWFLAYAMLGVAALGLATGLAAVIGLAIINYAPVVSMKFQNAKLAAIKAEARKNPVETLQNVYRDKELELHEKLHKIEAFATKVNQYELKCEKFGRDFPAEAPRFKDVLNKMKTLLDIRKKKWQESSQALNLFAKEIEKAGAVWEMSLASAELQESAEDVETQFFNRIKVETSLDSVQQSLSASMAQLDTLLLERVDDSAPSMITHQPADVIEMAPVKSTTKVTR